MKRITISEYAKRCGISPQAAHKRLKNIKNYKEIRGIERIAKNFFLLKVNDTNGFSNKRNNVAKINLVDE